MFPSKSKFLRFGALALGVTVENAGFSPQARIWEVGVQGLG